MLFNYKEMKKILILILIKITLNKLIKNNYINKFKIILKILFNKHY